MSVLNSQEASSTDTEVAQSAFYHELWTVCCRLDNYYVNKNDRNQTNTNKAI